MARCAPEQREMQMKISLYITQGVFIATPLLVLAVLASLARSASGAPSTSSSAAKPNMAASSRSGCSPDSAFGIVKTLLGDVVIFAGVAPESFNIKNFAPTNLGAFLNPTDTNAALYSLATSLDVITIWTLVLLGMGTAIVAGVKRTSGYIAVFGWWALFVLIGVGIAAITG